MSLHVPGIALAVRRTRHDALLSIRCAPGQLLSSHCAARAVSVAVDGYDFIPPVKS
jgi:hypothetical protein